MTTTENINLLRGSTLIGAGVENLQGENLGKIEDLVIDVDSGRIGYAVLSFGGFMGMGDKLFAVPWASLTYNTEKQKFMMDAHKDRLKNAPGFDKNDWPKTPNGLWVNEVYEFYGQEPHWTKTP
jgi:sporulation protein YlmC with PRC-barrel domain